MNELSRHTRFWWWVVFVLICAGFWWAVLHLVGALVGTL